MSRLTKKDYKEWVYVVGTTINQKASEHLNYINHKLGELEDILEEYGIEDLTDLKIALDYYNHRFDGLHTERIGKNEQH